MLEKRPDEASSIAAPQAHVYDTDGLRSIHNHEFMDDPAFQRAYKRSVDAAAGVDYGWHWRVHVGLWVASCASKLPGDFVECGVNFGMLSSAIMDYLGWNTVGKTFYLMDTFSGMDERFVSDEEKQAGILEKNRARLEKKSYVCNVESVRDNFSEWRNVTIVVGAIPETLGNVAAKKIAYLHLDMNCSPPEVAAAEYFWPRLVPGGYILLDDYGYLGHGSQKAAMDAFAKEHDVSIMSLPTGQGLMIKPAVSGNP